MALLNKVNGVFNHAGIRRAWLKVRIPVGLVAIAIMCCFVRREWFRVALAVSLFGEGIQLWCFAALHKGKELACKGPYACVRNPMYLGRYFIVLGFVLLLGVPGVWLVLPYTVFYWFYMRNRVAREEAYLNGALGADYEAYCRRVNRFVPSLRGSSSAEYAYWNWAWFTRNHGWLNAAALAAVYLILYLISGRLNG